MIAYTVNPNYVLTSYKRNNSYIGITNMKIFVSVLSVILFSVCSFASSTQSGQLDGAQYCRTIKIKAGFFGGPAREGRHCVDFSQGKMHDNADTFFGNPPTNSPYKLLDTGAIYTKNKSGKWEKSSYVYLDGRMTYNYIEMDIVSTIL